MSQGVIANPTYGKSASDIERFTSSDTFIILLLALGVLALLALSISLLGANARRKKRIKLAKRRAEIRRKRQQSIRVE